MSLFPVPQNMMIAKKNLHALIAILAIFLGIPNAFAATDLWVGHVACEGGWKTHLSVYYSGAESRIPYTLTRLDASGRVQGSPISIDATNHMWNALPDDLMAYSGSARIRSEQNLLVKVTYRYEQSSSLCEFYLTADKGQEWVLPNSIFPWFDWTGIALVNSTDAPVKVILEAWKRGVKVADTASMLAERSRYAQVSESIWNGLAYSEFDTIIVRASAPIPAPICITGNFVQDRHLFFTAQPKPQNSSSICLINGTLIDGTGREPVGDAVVVIKDGQILAVGKRGEMAIPTSCENIDVEGGHILPGFINTHVHNAFRENNLRTWAREGVTTVRDVGAAESPSVAFSIRDSMRSNPYCARVVAAGPLVTVPGGYPIVPNNFPALAVNSPEDARIKIGQLIDQGAELIKITLESGYGWPTLNSEEVSAIVDTAHARGIPVTAHVTRFRYLQWAIDAGVDDAGHSIVDSIPDEWIDRMIQGKMSLVPTLTAQSKGGESLQNLRRFVVAGGRVALGNDGGYIAGMEIGMPITEIEAMQEAGMTPMQIVVTATKNAAEVCRLENAIGTLEFGKEADIIVVKGNPLTDLRALLNVEHVFHRGVMIR